MTCTHFKVSCTFDTIVLRKPGFFDIQWLAFQCCPHTRDEIMELNLVQISFSYLVAVSLFLFSSLWRRIQRNGSPLFLRHDERHAVPYVFLIVLISPFWGLFRQSPRRTVGRVGIKLCGIFESTLKCHHKQERFQFPQISKLE